MSRRVWSADPVECGYAYAALDSADALLNALLDGEPLAGHIRQLAVDLEFVMSHKVGFDSFSDRAEELLSTDWEQAKRMPEDKHLLRFYVDESE